LKGLLGFEGRNGIIGFIGSNRKGLLDMRLEIFLGFLGNLVNVELKTGRRI
jgi:hypothetical protein